MVVPPDPAWYQRNKLPTKVECFDIEDIVPDGVIVNMPPFLGGRYQMTAAETEETMTIVSVRIHVERAIGRIKTYHILDGNLPNTLSPYATQIATV